MKFNLNNVTHLTELFSIVKNAKENISFWGYRYIYIVGYENTLPIDALASKLIELVRVDFDFSEDERLIGKSITPIIENLYEQNKKRINDKNWFTQIICKIRDLWKFNKEGGYGIKFEWDNYFWKDTFDYYTEYQYKKIFNKDPIRCTDWHDAYTGPNRWLAPA
ncbi:hypothetical protein [Candidatus Protochlamydia sp. R18]|uniref:hypothetical protein n=1 Tax=Candidatus Protochlamydia sp. R18 TaxID=1353977 RepID=UPI0005A6F359|nr:hypothetical protein [Candidatus Protochlamydia sp. R18]